MLSLLLEIQNKMWFKVISRVPSTTKAGISNVKVNLYRCLSTQIQEKFEEPFEITDTPKPPRVRQLKKFKDPFPKSFFVGKCDPEVLEYPEVLDNEEIESIKSLSKKVKEVVAGEVNSKVIEAETTIPKQTLQRLSDVGVLGLRLPRGYGGLELTQTEYTVIAEDIGIDGSLAKHITEQQAICGQFFKLYGSEEQKEKYLRPLIRGELTATYAYLESSNLSDTTSSFSTVALPSSSGGFEITGQKNLVYNASLADVLIVFASHPKREDDGQRTNALSAFLVPKNTLGVTVHPPVSKYGLRGVPISQVDFRNVALGTSNILGKPHEGLAMMMNVLGSKFGIAPSVVGISKAVLRDVTRHCINTNFMKKSLSELEIAKAGLGRMMTAIYALESATFLQAGLADTYEGADSFLETCILKVLASQTLQFVLKEAIQILGTQAHFKPEFQYLDRLIRDSHFHTASDESDFILKVTISLNGLQHAGMTVHDEVKRIRNPMMYPVFALKKLFEKRKRDSESYKLELGLSGYLHPTLQNPASALEFCISRVQMGAETLLSRYGKDILEKHFELASLADIAIRAYALTATLGRASRSYCIGLKESEADMEVALAYTNYCLRSVKRHYADLDDGPVLNNTNRYMMISERIFANKGYFAESPIERNF